MDLFTSVLVAITFLSVAVLASLGLKALRFPYTIGLMIIGLGVGAVLWNVPGLEGFRTLLLSPDLILYLVLPTLIFEASLNIDARLLFRNLVPILLLAVVGLLLSTLVVAYAMATVTPLALAGALLFGALISATDPVAVIALFKEIGAPKRLVTLIDGESLFNDATAIVLFTVLAAALGVEGFHSADPSVLGGAVSFVLVLLGGLTVGALVGWAGAALIQVDKGDVLFQIAVSLIMAYLSFLVADHLFHFSGVMSSLAAGLVLRYRAETAFRKHHIHTLEQLWEFFSFVANSFVFILLGLTAFHSVAREGNILDSLWPVLWSFPIVLLARLVSIVALVPGYNLILRARRRPSIPWNYQAVLFWGGLRGAVPVALVLAIPETFPQRDLILHLTFGIILFTLLIQGTTVKAVMRWLGVQPDPSPFADRATAIRFRDYPTPEVAELVLGQFLRGFEDEGFARSDAEHSLRVLRRGPQLMTLQRQGSRLQLECEPGDMGYARTVMSEALLRLKSSVVDLDEVEVQLPVGDESAPTSAATKVLRREHVVLLSPGTKDQVVRALIAPLVATGSVTDADALFRDVMDREQAMSTGLGRGVATPHAKTDAVNKAAVVVGVCAAGTDFQAFDGGPSRVFALIVSPVGEEGPHLEILSALTALLGREGLQKVLCDAKDADEVWALLKTQRARVTGGSTSLKMGV